SSSYLHLLHHKTRCEDGLPDLSKRPCDIVTPPHCAISLCRHYLVTRAFNECFSSFQCKKSEVVFVQYTVLCIVESTQEETHAAHDERYVRNRRNERSLVLHKPPR